MVDIKTSILRVISISILFILLYLGAQNSIKTEGTTSHFESHPAA